MAVVYIILLPVTWPHPRGQDELNWPLRCLRMCVYACMRVHYRWIYIFALLSLSLSLSGYGLDISKFAFISPVESRPKSPGGSHVIIDHAVTHSFVASRPQ